VRLSVADDGVGLPPGIDQTYSQTLGLKLVAALSDQLRGKFSLVNRGGAYATLLFRLGAASAAPAGAPKE
jgi:two-component sensor histidine kinase